MNVQVKGVKELTRALAGLSADLKVKGAERTTRAGASTILKAAKEKVPEKTGTLKRTLTIVKGHKKGSDRVTYFVTHKKKGRDDHWYAHLVEFGGVKGSYKIKPKRKEALADRSRSGMYTIYGKNTWHPKSRARPYMRPAFYENDDKAIDDMAKRLGRFIETGR